MAGAGSGGLVRIMAALALAGALVQACTPLASVAAQPVSEAEEGLVAVSGGVYPDRALAAYVRGVGMTLLVFRF